MMGFARRGVLLGVSLSAALGVSIAAAQSSPTASPSPAASTGTPAAPTGTLPPGTGTPAPTSSPAATPSPAGTPWPAPADVRVTVTASLVDANGRPVPPDQRPPDAVTVSWQVLPGYTGVFEVQRAIVPRGASGRTWTALATVPASAAAAGRASTNETRPALEDGQRCYRVRTVINGETGPYSAEACTVLAPVSGGAIPRVPVTTTPMPPGTGTGTPGRPIGWFEVACAALGALGIAAASTVAAGTRLGRK